MKHTFQYSYTNGGLEGKNNLIKVIKGIAFGYRSFYHFKIRIMIISNDLSLKKKAGEFIFSPAT
ncbi:transposase [Lysinibacillus sp. NPDC056232]|uniref:transposase n=1 Tax=Lysinibacillus sp. NPDC056232 TaxID=3345756 RepID=UPI0035D713AF